MGTTKTPRINQIILRTSRMDKGKYTTNRKDCNTTNKDRMLWMEDKNNTNYSSTTNSRTIQKEKEETKL